jgi:Family of unknown function (DUF6386)
MPSAKQIATDTATLVVFDPSRLSHRLHDDDDWWSIPAETEEETNAGNALFVSLGSDGVYNVEVSTEPTAARPIATVVNESGTFVIGPGEQVVAGGFQPEVEHCLFIAVRPGRYGVHIEQRGTQIRVQLAAVALDAASVAPSSSRELPQVWTPGYLASCLDAQQSDACVAALVAQMEAPTVSDTPEGRWVTAAKQGIELVFADDRLRYVHLYDECVATRTRDAFARWPHELPAGLEFGADKVVVEAKMGAPLRATSFWAIYDRGSYGVRVGYSNGRLTSLNLLSKNSAVLSQSRDRGSR